MDSTLFTMVAMLESGSESIDEKGKIQYGICGHILGAGGRGVNAAQEPVEVGKMELLWVNAGSAITIPWKWSADIPEKE